MWLRYETNDAYDDGVLPRRTSANSVSDPPRLSATVVADPVSPIPLSSYNGEDTNLEFDCRLLCSVQRTATND